MKSCLIAFAFIVFPKLALGLSGFETYAIEGLDDALSPRRTLTVNATAGDGSVTTFGVLCRIDPTFIVVERTFYIEPVVLAADDLIGFTEEELAYLGAVDRDVTGVGRQ